MRGGGLRGSCGGGNSASSKAASIIPVVAAGTFRDKVDIQVPNLVPDNRGGGVYNWSTIATVWARVETIDRSSYIGYVNKERFEEGQLMGRRHFMITIRYGPPVTTVMRLIYRGKDLEIESVINKDELNWELMLFCRELGKGEP
jgi:SPP1 family predicted phage head-tail adaptor